MPQIIPRAYPRTECRAPIQYAPVHSQQFQSTHMYDYSADGLCYETDQELEPESEICIVMENYAPGLSGPEGFRSYVARVRWIKLLQKNGSKHYAAGAQIVTRSHEILISASQAQRHLCDLCGALMPLSQAKGTEEGAQLCDLCFEHVDSIPSKRIRKCVERFLIGNVV